MLLHRLRLSQDPHPYFPPTGEGFSERSHAELEGIAPYSLARREKVGVRALKQPETQQT